MAALKVDGLIVNALDEVAWLLNIRGSDVSNIPVLLAYMYVSATDIYLFADSDKIGTDEMLQHLTNDVRLGQLFLKCIASFTSISNNQLIFRIRDYQAFISDLRDLTASAEKVLIPKQFSYSGGSSYAVYNSVINQIDLKLGYLIKICKKK